MYKARYELCVSWYLSDKEFIYFLRPITVNTRLSVANADNPNFSTTLCVDDSDSGHRDSAPHSITILLGSFTCGKDFILLVLFCVFQDFFPPTYTRAGPLTF